MKKTLLIGFYHLLTHLLFPFFLLFLAGALILRPGYRRNIRQRFGWYPSDFFSPILGKKVFWIHAASVGEVMMGRMFIQALRKRSPDAGIVLSTITPTGQETALEHLKEIDLMIYFPFDIIWMTGSVIRKMAPDLFLFLETEIWPGTLQALSTQGIPSIMINGRISDGSFRHYRKLRPFMSQVFEAVDLFLMQSARDLEKIIDIGALPARVKQTGNMKYDQALQPIFPNNSLGLEEDALLMIAGSTRSGEEEMVLEAYQILEKTFPAITLLLAPRHLNRLAEVEKVVSKMGYIPVRKSELSTQVPHQKGKCSVILLDTLGELTQLYPLGHLIFVGGSLIPVGGHNLLEPAAASKPVFFGPYTSNFKEIAEQMKSTGGGIEVSDGKELGEKMRALIQDKDLYIKRGHAARQVVMNHQGAVKRNLDQVIEWMDLIEKRQARKTQ
ncbi:MAG: 3-deoxy-D-manno-octulosonic acid transferase [Nitrospiria bacterium]